MKALTPSFAAGVLAGLLGAASFLGAPASAANLAGSIVGRVTDGAGVPQMGATVLLYNRYDRLLGRALTDEKGSFSFHTLVPDIYAVRVSLASFLPALRRNIVVRPGSDSLLQVNLASVFSSIELVYKAPGQRALMSEDWKWVLRTSDATRPILRFVDFSDPTERPRTPSSVFSDTRGLVRLSAGDEGRASGWAGEPDLGTAFALATSLFGSNQLQFSGNIGYASESGVPAAGFRTSYSREFAGGLTPEVKLTMRQTFLPVRAGTALLTGQRDAAPALRTMSVTLMDKTEIGDGIRLLYGYSLDSVSFLDRLNYLSPFAKLTYKQGDSGAVEFSYASGSPPVELFSAAEENDIELKQDLAALAQFPRVSLQGGRARVQRLESYEVGYRNTVASRTYSVAAYRDSVSNAALTLASPGGFLTSADLLPDLFSNSWILNAGRYTATGYVASVSEKFGEGFDLTVSVGNSGALTIEPKQTLSGGPSELRDAFRASRRHLVTAKLSGTAPGTGTRFVTSYQWASARSLIPAHLYATQRVREETGLNLYVRQPLPGLSGLPGRFEATADLRNLLSQGYVPLNFANGRRSYLVHTPRSVRGGVSFIF